MQHSVITNYSFVNSQVNEIHFSIKYTLTEQE